jgi:uncharacterized cupredoxin-like copper-binding protein
MLPAVRSTRIRRLCALVAGAVLMSACSSTASSQPSAAPSAAPASAAAPGSAAAGAITAKLSEFKIELSATSAKAGSVTLQTTNAGAVVHEFVVLKTDLAADKLPVDASAGEVKEDDPSLTLVDEIEDIAVGSSPSLTVDLPAGHYVVICNVSGHYTGGMRVDFTTQ